MAFTVVESTNMGTTHYDGKIFDAVANEDIENGTFGYIDGLQEGSDTIYNFKKGFKAGEPVFMVDHPAWDEDTHHRTNQRKDKYVNKAGDPFRIREIKKNDKVSVTIDGVTSASKSLMKKDAYVTIDATTGKLVAKATPTDGATFEGIVEGVRTSGATLTTKGGTVYGHSAVLYKVRIAVYGSAGTTNVTNNYTVVSYVYTQVAEPTGNPSTSGYYEKDENNVFTASTDTTVDSEKTYYTRTTA